MMKRILSVLLCIAMLMGVLPVSAFATQTDSNDPPENWLELYQAAAIAEMERQQASTFSMRTTGDFTAIPVTPSYSMISWGSGRLEYASGTGMPSPMPMIRMNGDTAFCVEWNGIDPSGTYTNAGEGNDTTILQILANYENSSQSSADYAAAQAAIWSHLLGSPVSSWGGCPGESSADAIFNGSHDYSNIRYTRWTGGTQDCITYSVVHSPQPGQPGQPDQPVTPDVYPPEEYDIQVETKTDVRTEIRNQKSYVYSDAIGQITIRKHDQDGKSLDGALFDIDVAFSDGSHTTVENWEVDNGARLFTWTHPQDNHDPATVTVTEVCAPQGYRMDSATQTAIVAPTYTRVTHVETWSVTITTETTTTSAVKITSGEVVAQSASSSSSETASEPQVEEYSDFVEGDREVTMTFVNTVLPGALVLCKLDADTGENLSGAVFKLYKGSEEDPKAYLGDWKTGSNGSVVIPNLDPGYYTIVESQAPDGYLLDAENRVQIIEIKQQNAADGNMNVVFRNYEKPSLRITKIDAATGEPIAGAVFRVARRASAEYVDVTLDANGTCVLDGLEPDWYEVTELRSPVGYAPSDEHYDILLVAGKTAELIVQNHRLPTLTIRKTDSMTLQPLEGVVFEIGIQNGKSLGEFTTNSEGEIVLEQLDAGRRYWIKETDPLPGYLSDETVHEITLTHNEDGVVEIRNTPEQPIIISKKDAVTGKPIPNTVFLVTHVDGRLVGEYRTGENGMATVVGSDVVPGWYMIREVEANPAYIASEESQLIELKLGAPTVVEFYNAPRTSLQIRKIDSVTGEPIPNVGFLIEELGGRDIGTFYTNDMGIIELSDQEEIWVQVTETAPANGYKPDHTVHTIELLSGEQNVLEVRNQPYPKLQIVKTDAETGVPLANVKFKLFDSESHEIGLYTTNAQGIILLTGMDAGRYFLQEYETLSGYAMDESVHEIELYWGKTTKVSLANKRLGHLLLRKVDHETGEPLAGAVFLLYDEKNVLLGEYTTDIDGVMQMPQGLPEGHYTVREVQAPKGYVLDEKVHPFTIKSGTTLELEIANQPVQGQIRIVKKAADVNPITKAEAGALLAGAVFEVYNESLQVVDTITTDENGVAVTEPLPLGVYGIKEITPPAYYVTEGKVFYAELKVADDLVRFEVLNQSAQVGVMVDKRGNAEVLPGDGMSYSFENIQNNSNVPLEEFYWEDQLPGEVRIEKIVTGTWSESLTYAVSYKTNLRDTYRALAGNLSSRISHTLDCSKEALKLAENEYITDVRFSFGTVQPDFCEVEQPMFVVSTLPNLADGYRIINRTEVGGQIGERWITEKDSWVTVVWAGGESELPKTGIHS